MTKRIEFSKLILMAVMATYFYGVHVGAETVRQYPEYLPAYLAYIGAPVGIAIGFYAWKARAENLVKLGRPVSEAGEMETSAPEMLAEQDSGPFIEP